MRIFKRVFISIFILFTFDLSGSYLHRKPSKNIDRSCYICPRLNGQLGNQMFQIATAYALAAENGCQFFIQEKYQNDKNFNFDENTKRFFHRCPYKNIQYFSNKYHEPDNNGYHPIHFKPNMELYGYFQSEKYFYKYKKEICELFAPSESIRIYLNEHYSDIINSTKTVGIHIRTWYPDWKGIPNPKKPYMEKLPPPDFEFITKAINLFPEDFEFIIFSDYIPWCKNFLKDIPRKIRFIEEKYEYDFFLLSLCKHQIIAESSFAWWAAYLNPNPNKIVVARTPWYRPQRKIEDALPQEWVKIPGNPNPPYAIFE